MENFDLFDDDLSEVSTVVQTQKSLVDAEQRLGLMLDAMPIGLLFHTEQSVLYANQEACRLLKASKSELIGQHFLDHIRDAELEKTSALLSGAFADSEEVNDLESIVHCADGTELLVKIIVGRLPWEGTPVIQLLFQDITAQKRAENSLRKLSITDALTGAYNRRHLMYEASLYMDQKAMGLLSAALIDIDHFKSINDRYGHAVGDLALKDLTKMAHALVPTIDGADSAMFARYGGEEFLLLLPGLDLKAAEREAQRFCASVKRLRIASEDGEITGLSVSIGVATFRASDKNIDGFLSRADKALYQAKDSGRDRVCLAT